MNYFNRMIAQSARQWRVPPSVAAWIFWMPLAGAVAMVLARFDKRLFTFFLREDGPVEWGQAACFLVACLAAAGVAVFLVLNYRRLVSDYAGHWAASRRVRRRSASTR